MKDPQMKAFAGRLRRIDRIHRRGGGFEAAGTLGQSHYTRLQRRSRRPFLRPVLMALALMLVFKATLMAHLGAGEYEARVEALRGGTLAEQAGALVMAADPATLALAPLLEGIVPR